MVLAARESDNTNRFGSNATDRNRNLICEMPNLMATTTKTIYIEEKYDS